MSYLHLNYFLKITFNQSQKSILMYSQQLPMSVKVYDDNTASN